MSAASIAKAREKRSQLRSGVFPTIDEAHIWDVKNKKKTKGYISLPRVFPLMSIIMDRLAGKGKPVSGTYLELWCRSDEQGFVILNKQGETAFASGFSGERGVSTWKERVRRLEALGFVSTAPGPSGDMHYVQIWNPYLVVQHHAKQGTEGFSHQHYNGLLERVSETGAKDLEDAADGS